MKNKTDIQSLVLAARILHFLGKESGVFPYAIYSDWKHLLPEIFFEQYDETEIFNAIDASFKEKWTGEKIKKDISHLSYQEQLTLSQLIFTFLHLIKNTDNLIAWKNLSKEYQKQFIESEVALPNFESSKNQVEEWLEKKEKNAFRPIISIRVSLILIFLDFGIRSLGLFLEEYKNLIGMNETNGFYIIWHFLITPSILIVSILSYRYINQKRIKQKLSKLNLSEVKITPFIGAWDYFIIALLSIMGVGIGELVMDDFTSGSVFGFSALILVLFIWYLIILRFFSLPLPSSKQIYHQLKERDQIEIEDDLGSDENDIEIVNQEVKLRSLNEKMNAFVLEAALFGALAFSGFIQIISSEVFSLDAFMEFNSTIIELLRGLVTGNAESISTYFEVLRHRSTMLSLLCYESLFCSICFLSVISSRIRYGDLTDKLDRSLELSKNFNKKEESLIIHHKLKKDDNRVLFYTKKVKENLQKGLKDYSKIKPVLEYMRFFRTLGISTFFIIIITSGLFISPLVSSLFLGIFILSFVYFKFDTIKSAYVHFRTKIQELRAETETSVTIGFLVVVLAVSVYRTYYLPGSQFLAYAVLIILIFHQISLIVEGKRYSFTDITFTRIIRVGVILIVLGTIFKWGRFPGASVLLILSTFFVSFFFFFHPIHAEKSKVIRLLSVAFALGALGTLFKIQHWPLASILVILGSISFLVFLFIMSIKGQEKLNYAISIGLALGFIAAVFKIQHWPGSASIQWIGIFGMVIGFFLLIYKKTLFGIPNFYKGIVIFISLVIMSTGLFKGIPMKLIMRLNWDIGDAKKEVAFNQSRRTFWVKAQEYKSKDEDHLNFAENDNLKVLLDNYFNTEMVWTKKEPIWGSFAVADEFVFYQLGQGDKNLDVYSQEQIHTIIDYHYSILDTLNTTNEHYIQSHGYRKEELFAQVKMSASYFLLLSDSLKGAQQFLGQAKPFYVSVNDEFMLRGVDSLQAKIDARIDFLETENVKIYSDSILSMPPN